MLNQIIRVFLLFFIVTGCSREIKNAGPARIAFMADVHLHDVYGEYTDGGFDGVRNPATGKNATIRTMAAQLHSTRMFNENYFAFLAALDDLVGKGVKMVILPGDFSDDGQPVNVRGLKEILDDYSEKFGISFYITTGNHDPVRPFYSEGGKRDFLGTNGRTQAVMSKEGMYGTDDTDPPVAVSKDIGEMGYRGIMELLGEYGFFPDENDIYWETPFSNYTYDTYSYSRATEEALYENRQYPIPPTGFMVPDASYLVEPENGLWLLAIDANVYVPVNDPDDDPMNPGNYSGASIGYNQVLTHKAHLVEWVKKISRKARELSKTLVVFSHYPMVDFHNDASPEIQHLLGQGKMQTHRVPVEEVARIFANAGVQLHFAGHLHVNDTGVRKTSKGNTLVNVQIPSLAAYIPAYKLLTIHPDKMEIETIVIDSVPRFNEFFGLYRQEYDFQAGQGDENMWNKDILTSQNYFEYTEWHLRELVRLRFIPSDWSSDFADILKNLSGKDLVVLSQLDEPAWNTHIIEELKESIDWDAAVEKAKKEVLEAQLSFEEFEKWNGKQFILDFYKLRSADELAFNDIGSNRLKQYKLLTRLFLNRNGHTDNNETSMIYRTQKEMNKSHASSIGPMAELNPAAYNKLNNKYLNKLYSNEIMDSRFRELSFILNKFLNGVPSFHFTVDRETGEVESLVNN